MSKGAHLKADAALELGLLDKVVDEKKGIPGLLSAAITYAKSQIGAPIRRICDLPCPAATDFEKWAVHFARSRRGEPAGPAIVRCVKAACSVSTFSDGVEVEKRFLFCFSVVDVVFVGIVVIVVFYFYLFQAEIILR